MDFYLTAGGREYYYKKLFVRDCATRAVAIANDMDYKEAYNLLKEYNGESPRNGVYKSVTNKVLKNLGWKYHPLRSKPYLANFERDEDVIICRLDINHITTIKNGDLYDIWDCRRKNPKVVGYWTK